MSSKQSAMTSLLALLPLLVHASPISNSPGSGISLKSRDPIQTLCGQNDIAQVANFILYNNLWGENSATGGSQCTYLDYDQGDSISWQTNWNWNGGEGLVKSYANAVLNVGATQLSAINSMPSTWDWHYKGDGMVADVSYDAFFSSEASTTAPHNYEVMIWLAALGGIEPIGYSSGPVATPNIDGTNWSLYVGQASGNDFTTFSFVAPHTMNHFSGDLNHFFNYLTSNQNVPSSLYLQTTGAGTEPEIGSNAWFTTKHYQIDLH